MYRVQISCPWNKKKILGIQNQIPNKHKESYKWEYNDGYIYVYELQFEFQDGDIIQLADKKKYLIIILNGHVSTECMECDCDKSEKWISIEDFLKMIDYDYKI
jgi:hypothetical protein